MAKTSGNRNTPVKQSNLPAEINEGFFDAEYTGFEEVSQDMLQLPFLKVAQALTPQIKKSKPEYIEGLEQGLFFNNVSCSVYGKSVKVVILKTWQSFVEWQPNRGGFVQSMTPEEWQETKEKWFKETGFIPEYDKKEGGLLTPEGNVIKDTRNFFVILPEYLDEGVIWMANSGSGVKPSKILTSKTRMIKAPNDSPAPIYGVVWNLTIEDFEGGEYSQIATIKQDRNVWDDADLMKAVVDAKDYVKSISDKELNYDNMDDKVETESYEDI
jgi:hypothetical protein